MGGFKCMGEFIRAIHVRRYGLNAHQLMGSSPKIEGAKGSAAFAFLADAILFLFFQGPQAIFNRCTRRLHTPVHVIG